VTRPDTDFLIPAVNQWSDQRFRAPKRAGVIVTPLVDGEEAFLAMEEAIQAATRSVHIAFWFFNPATPLRSKKQKGTWATLLRGKVAERKDLVVRIILTDLDAVLQKFYHQAAWKAYRLLFDEIQKLALSERRRFQVICSRHSARIRSVAEPLLAKPTETIIAELNATARRKGVARARADFQTLPGLWENVQLNLISQRFELVEKPSWVVFPASHHQKIVVVDGETAFCGGLDVNTGRIDNPRHEPRKKISWHDVDCRVVGPVVDDIERNFRARWNAELPPARAFLEEVNVIRPPLRIDPIGAEPFDPPIKQPRAPTPPQPGKAEIPVTAQIHRTLSVDDLLSPTPIVVRNDILVSYKRAIELAESFVYIENQYVRSHLLKEWLERRAQDNSELSVIMVVPVAPEEFSTANGADALTEHGMFLQRTLIERLQDVLQERFGVFSMVRKTKASAPSKTDAHDSAQIYVHSKLLIVDDRFASVGSANANGRGFVMDTELALAYVGPTVRDLRVKLWTELLGSPDVAKWKPTEFVARWNDIAKANAKAPASHLPRGRQGFVVPHDTGSFPGTENPRIPAEFTELLDPKTTPADEEEALA
jgi:phosphatidylserine/phosphatidylglycerophosphate/cardiolipin synthase-like enzyme